MMGQTEFLEIIKKLEELISATAVEQKRAAERFPKNDGRMGAFGTHATALKPVHLGLVLLSKHLLVPEWWKNISGGTVSHSDLIIRTEQFHHLLIDGMVHGLSITLETTLRNLVRALDDSACGGGQAPYESIYKWLLKRLSLHTDENIALLSLLRLLRNTNHNNGVHIDRKGKDYIVEWQGKDYSFNHGEPVDLVYWPFLLEIAEKNRQFLETLVYHPEIQSLTFVTDPANK